MANVLTIRSQSGHYVTLRIWDRGDEDALKAWFWDELGEKLNSVDVQKMIEERRPLLGVSSGHDSFVQSNSPFAIETPAGYYDEEDGRFWRMLKLLVSSKEFKDPRVALIAYLCRMAGELKVALPQKLLP